jgi:shikimate kinase
MIPSCNIFLVGLMGAGKTTIGKLLARQRGLEFLDSDQEIVARCGVSIPTIFEIEGEAGFRKREAAMIDELSQRKGIVLATGGGAVLLEENRTHLKARGTVVYLRCQPQELYLRTRHDKNRPLLQTDDPLQKAEGALRHPPSPLHAGGGHGAGIRPAERPQPGAPAGEQPQSLGHRTWRSMLGASREPFRLTRGRP